MRSQALLSVCLVAAAQGSNLLYPKGCSDASKANYWPDNPDSEAACLPKATVYCPDPLADNYDAASRKLRPRTSRIPCPPLPASSALTCSPRQCAPAPCALVGAHTRAPDAWHCSKPRLPPHRRRRPCPRPRQSHQPPNPTPGPRPNHRATTNGGPAHRAACPFLAWQLPGAIPPIVPTSRMRWPLRPSARTTSMGAPTRSLPTTRASCRRPPAISGP